LLFGSGFSFHFLFLLQLGLRHHAATGLLFESCGYVRPLRCGVALLARSSLLGQAPSGR
jgi:hypothetical protein